MPADLRLTSTERRLRRDLEGALGRLDLDGGPVLAALTGPVAEFLGLDMPGSMGYVATDRGDVRCNFLHGMNGNAPTIQQDISESMEGDPVRWVGYNPLCPEPAQRNRSVTFSPEIAAVHRIGEKGVLKRAGIGDMHHLRVLVCEESSLLAWVGGFQIDPIRPRQVALLASVTPALHRRLVAERRVAGTDLAARALDAALEQIGAAAWVLDRGGHVRHANAAGRARLGHDRGLRARLAPAIRGADRELDAYPLASNGVPAEHLVIERRGAGLEAARVVAAAKRWNLTPRQAEVLALLATGDSNAAIAGALGISERTVEVHVTAVLDRAGRGSRAELIAAIWAVPA